MRDDIQCLRGIAILFVFLFHLFPKLFVNGFLGVDMFFVISGFLMAKNLTKTDPNPVDQKYFLKYIQHKACGVFSFYYKRFRRILPTYYLVLLFSIVLVHLFLEDFLWRNNERYSLASMLLITNQLIIHDQSDYFSEFAASTSSMNVFIHLWSLAVEMQFYLLVPIIFLCLHHLPNDYWKLAAVAVMTVVGFVPFVLVLEKFSFNFMLFRLWQFSAGFTALFWSRINSQKLPCEENQEKRKCRFPITKDDVIMVSVAVLAICLVPHKIDVEILRPLITLVTAFIIACESKSNKVLNSSFIGYIGDISYIVYLVHWPIISIFLTDSARNYVFCILITLVSSVIIRQFFEKHYLKFDVKSVFLLVFILIGCNVYLQYSVEHDGFWKKTIPEEVKKVMDQNWYLSESLFDVEKRKSRCIEHELAVPFAPINLLGYCRFPPGKGNISIMVIGNSYVLNFMENFRSHFKSNYSEFRYISILASYGIVADGTLLSHQALEVSKQQVEKYKPDVLVIMPRYMRDALYPVQPNDTLVQEMKRNIEHYEKIVKKLYILDAHPLYDDNFLSLFLHFVVSRPEDLELLHMNRKKADDVMMSARQRIHMTKCKKCQIFNLSDSFLENDKYLTFDRKTMLSYVDNSVHLTATGVERCSPALEKVAKDIMNSF